MLAGGSATTARVLAAIDGAGLAHIAAHGTFRADSPMFSSLRLDDGPLALHRRLRSAGPGAGALAAALRDARADACHATAGDPVVTAAGWSFIALGA